MKPEKVREIDTAEIKNKLSDMQEQLFRLRFQISMGQTEGVKKLRDLKKDRARMLTVVRQRELEQRKG
jgi:large subunit ribosomal protein L29